jgi:hypothetical protein
MALQPGSPAIDAGAAAGCPATDARGVLRPAGAGCDIGAFEVATPVAATGAASGVRSSAATLNGTATNPDLTSGTVTFQYGTTTTYGSQTSPEVIGAGTRGAAIAAAIAGLAPATTYHFRAVATNAIGTAVGADRSFTTPAQTQTPKGGPNAKPRAHLKVTSLGGLRFKLKCTKAAACHAKLVARATQGRRKVVAGSLESNVGAGHSRKVTLKLNDTGRRLAAATGKVALVVTVTVAEPTGKPTVARVIHRTL